MSAKLKKYCLNDLRRIVMEREGLGADEVTIAGVARRLGIPRLTLQNYSERPDVPFSSTRLQPRVRKLVERYLAGDSPGDANSSEQAASGRGGLTGDADGLATRPAELVVMIERLISLWKGTPEEMRADLVSAFFGFYIQRGAGRVHSPEPGPPAKPSKKHSP